jgi:hypothetical protein
MSEAKDAFLATLSHELRTELVATIAAVAGRAEDCSILLRLGRSRRHRAPRRSRSGP